MEQEQFFNNVSKYIHLVSLYLNKKDASDLTIDDNELSFFVKLSKHHSLVSFLYKVIKDTKVNVSEQSLKRLEEYYYSRLQKVVLFDKERKSLYQYLNENQIDYLPLKGLIIKDFYLDPYTREFADNDILFDPNKDELVKKFFTSRHYEIEQYKKTNHDVYLKKPVYNFEMHRALFMVNEDYPSYVAYFENCLKNSPVKEGYEHYLNKEDFYIYFTAHSYKHYQNSGCGIRTLVDYYLYLKNNNLDFSYINQELEKLDLVDFSNKFRELAIKIFDETPLTDEEKETLLFIASSGTYGTLENSVSKGVKKKGKFRYFMSRIFPPMSYYKTYHSWAYKSKVLIPVAWFIRFFRILFKNPGKATKELKMITKSKEEKKSN